MQRLLIYIQYIHKWNLHITRRFPQIHTEIVKADRISNDSCWLNNCLIRGWRFVFLNDNFKLTKALSFAVSKATVHSNGFAEAASVKVF